VAVTRQDMEIVHRIFKDFWQQSLDYEPALPKIDASTPEDQIADIESTCFNSCVMNIMRIVKRDLAPLSMTDEVAIEDALIEACTRNCGKLIRFLVDRNTRRS
jgi:hypothetical protein